MLHDRPQSLVVLVVVSLALTVSIVGCDESVGPGQRISLEESDYGSQVVIEVGDEFDIALLELQRETGWIIEWSTDDRTITFAIAPYGSVNDEPWDEFGPLTKVETYPVRGDAAFVLLEPNSSGEPPETVADFDTFVSKIEAAINGEGSFFASSGFTLTTPDEPGYPFALLVTPEGALQQVAQIWGP